jgi:hypothetical protein
MDLSPVALDVSLREYVDYIVDDQSPAARRIAAASACPRPFYCYSYKPFQQHPELLEDFTLPPFVIDWFSLLDPSFAAGLFPGRQGWILLGKRGVVSQLHQDACHTLTWLAQIRGRKRCYLFAPDDGPRLASGAFDPATPDRDRYPLARAATLYEAVLEPGAMLFLPPDWWHHVVAEEDSITVSYNLVNHVNFGLYLRRALGRDLPALLAALERPASDSSGHREQSS